MQRAMQESGGNPKAINLWDINAQRGIPSMGLFQTIRPTFEAYKLPGMNDIWNPVHNAVAAIRYMIARYGSVFNLPRGGYDEGGWLPPGVSLAVNKTGRPERILSPRESAGTIIVNVNLHGPVLGSAKQVARELAPAIRGQIRSAQRREGLAATV
jgi:SLT domain-containing protein